MLTFKVLATLLVYPEQEVIDSLDEMATILDREGLLPAAERRGVRALTERLRAADLMDAQAAYVSLFDQSRSLSLHLFEHIHGDSRERGQAMANLVEHYRSKGLEVSVAELPDFLPLFLEFLSMQPLDEAQALLSETVDIVALIRARLERRGAAPYAAAFRAVEALSVRRADERTVRETVAGERPDDTAEALDASWEDQPVTFRDDPPAAGCGPARTGAASVVDRFAQPVRDARPTPR